MSKTSEEAMGTGDERFPADTKGLNQATPPEAMFLEDGDHFDLRITPVRKVGQLVRLKRNCIECTSQRFAVLHDQHP
jgi:hypothetical protein